MTDDPEQGLCNADLTGQDFSGVDLRDKDLSLSDFSCACLCGTKFQKAQVHGTKFQYADLSRAEFRDGEGSPEAIAGSQAKGLLAASLAGSNLEGALLPAEIASFDRLHNVEEASKNGTTILLAMLAVCLFCLLTAGTFSDAALITNSGSTAAIPGVGLALPVGPFLYAAPFLLLAFHLYFILNLQRYEELISDLPSIFPDGVPLHLKIYPWLFSSLIPLARARMPQFGPKARLVWFETSLAVVLAYLLAPVSIWIIWFRALGGHFFSAYTTLFVLGVSIALSFLHFAVGRATLLDGHPISLRTRSIFPWWLICLMLIAGILFGIGTGITIQARRGTVAAPPGYISLDKPPARLGVWKRIVLSVGYFQTATVTDEAVSRKPVSWTGKESFGEPELKAVTGATLEYQNLRFLRAFRAFLVNSQLIGADLTEAVLAFSDLRGSDLTSATLLNADLHGARVSSTATPTNLRYANLTGARFTFASLRKANFHHAIVTNTDFTSADLSGADLTGTKITVDQIEEAASVDDETSVDEPLLLKSCVVGNTLLVSLGNPTETDTSIVRNWTVLPPQENLDAAVNAAWKKRLASHPKCGDQ